MTVSKFLSTAKLVDYLEQEQRNARTKAGLFPLADYGWCGEDTPDHVGIAKWGLEPPWELKSDRFMAPAQAQHRCSPPWRAQELTHLGDDFEAAMSLALGAIGQTLVFLALSEQQPFFDYQWFGCQQISAQMLLDIATDRLRSFFILAYFRQRAKSYNNGQGVPISELKARGLKPRFYLTPFAHAAMEHEGSLADKLRELKGLADALFQYRKQRNEVVHEQLRAAKRKDKSQRSVGECELLGPKGSELPRPLLIVSFLTDKPQRESLSLPASYVAWRPSLSGKARCRAFPTTPFQGAKSDQLPAWR